VLRLPDKYSEFGIFRANFILIDSVVAERANRSIAGANMVIAVVDIKASSERYEELRRAHSSLAGLTEAEAGCKSCQLYQDVTDTSVLRVETRWTTRGDLLRHIRSDTYKRFLLLMELSFERPMIEFYTVSELRGLDQISEAREVSD
jgi:quinol monooxygenase YgiN